MANKQELKWNLEQLTDAAIYAAIRYLDPDTGSANEQDNAADPAFVVCVVLVILVLAELGYAWLYW